MQIPSSGTPPSGGTSPTYSIRRPGKDRASLAELCAVAAPGSVLLLGEYAVTERAPGVAVAVHPDVHATFERRGPPRIIGRMATQRFNWTPQRSDSPLFSALVERCGPPEGCISVDSTEFAGPHGKLGLGSSAAVAVVVAALLLARRQPAALVAYRDSDEVAAQAQSVTTAEGRGTGPACRRGAADARERCRVAVRRRVFSAALAAHREAQGGRGSGYDVATSVWGGVVRFTGGRNPTIFPYAPQVLPELCVVIGGRPLATPAAVARYEQWCERAPPAAERFRTRSREVVEQFLAATDATACCAAIDAGGSLIRWLGPRIGVTVEPPELRDRLDEFRACGWATKPVGAGGELGIAASLVGTEPPNVPYAMPLRLASEGLRWLTS